MDKELSSRELEAQADALLAEAGEVEEIPMEKLPVRSKKAAEADKKIPPLDEKQIAALPAAAILQTNEKLRELFAKGKHAGKLESGECKVIMILEESVLKIRNEENSSLTCLYPEDGVVLIPSTVMTVKENKSANANIEACQALTDWLLSEPGQKAIIAGYMHGVLTSIDDTPVGSIALDKLISNNIPVDWERCYKERDEIRARFQEAVTLP